MYSEIQNMKSLLLLVIDDSPVFTERICTLLKELKMPCITTTANSYDEAEEVLRQIKPDLIFLDINLGRQSGIQLLKQIRRNYINSEVAILTNNSNSFYDKACEQAGASYFLDKTFDLDRVPGIISEVFSAVNGTAAVIDQRISA